ncbi:MAG: pyrroloquinoline quinone-dependent dehydrogenase [Acidobacteria bacterium]|nr:pyrroloquinoline quinone-dependent dehydrogenase [Acidobacteriota bacterium]
MSRWTAGTRMSLPKSFGRILHTRLGGDRNIPGPGTHGDPCAHFVRLIVHLVALLLLPWGNSYSQEWSSYGGDLGGTKYSSLDQINTTNVTKLKVAWVYDTGDFSEGTEYPTRSAFEATPLAVDGVLYVTTPFCRLVALDAETGEKRWEFDPQIDKSMRINLFVNRGPAYWSDGKRRRLFLGDLHGRLFAIDAATGKPDSEFGREGLLDLKEGVTEKFSDSNYALTSPVAVCRDVVIAGSMVSDSAPTGPSGDVRGFDAQTGRQLWRFHTVPQPGEFGHDTWEGDSWKDRGGTNAWSILSVDEQNGLVFLPLTSPSYDFFGGDRKGANIFGNSLAALDCKTGDRKWHFQTVHHDVWDYDLASQPVLVNVRRDGREVPAVAQVTKMGFVFLLDRLAGKPLFDVEERPMPKSEIPGEQTWPTQPFPVKPPPFARQSMSRDEITDVTPESRRECSEMLKDAVVDVNIFDPLGEKPSVIFPGLNGGANWGGASFDPRTGVLYVNSMDVGGLFRLVKRPEGSTLPYALRAQKYEFLWDSNGYPCQKPPWGSLTAIDLNSGNFRWRVTLGEFDELKARGVPKTGTPNMGGSIVTAGGLVFIAATNDGRFRAFDKVTGEELWVTTLPASGLATPMTFVGRRTGKQFVVIAAGGGNKYDKKFTGKLVAFSLPD